jgi:hypothetical protein
MAAYFSGMQCFEIDEYSSFPCKIKLIRRVPLVDQELPTLSGVHSFSSIVSFLCSVSVIRRRSVDNFSPHVLVQTEETYNFGTDYRDIPGKWNKTFFTVESCYFEHV